jgi:hypothetical protein
VLVWAVVGYPALRAIAPPGVDANEWGPPVLLLVRVVRRKLLPVLRMQLLLVCNVFWRRLRRVVVFLLQKWIQVVLVLLVRRGQMRTGPLPLIPLCGLQAVGRLIVDVVRRLPVALAH